MINLTPHAIVIRLSDGSDRTIPSAGVARVVELPGQPIPAAECPDGLPCWTNPTYPEGMAVDGLPESVDGVSYIVSGMVAARIRQLKFAGVIDRQDVYSPGTGPQDGAIRDAKGQIVAVTRLIRA